MFNPRGELTIHSFPLLNTEKYHCFYIDKEFQLEVTNDNYVCRQGRDQTEVVLVDEAFQSIVKVYSILSLDH